MQVEGSGVQTEAADKLVSLRSPAAELLVAMTRWILAAKKLKKT